MTALIASLLSNPTLIAIFGGIILAIGALFKGRIDGAKAERNANLAKEAKANAKNIEDIIRAGDARPIDGVPDPHDRDTWK